MSNERMCGSTESIGATDHPAIQASSRENKRPTRDSGFAADLRLDRGMTPFAIALTVIAAWCGLFFWVIGLILWSRLRPNPTATRC
jgi:hypothetical protein